MEPKDPIVWRVIGANVVTWIGAGIGALVAPEFGGDAFSSIVAAQNAMVGAFTGALFGGGFGWLIDRAVGNNRRQHSGNSYAQRSAQRPTHPDNRPGPRPSEPGSGAGLRYRNNRPGNVSVVAAFHNGDNVEVSWTVAERAASYEVFYQTSVMSSWTRAAEGHTDTAFVLTDAEESETYTFAVRAMNSAGVSDWTTSAPTSR